MKNTNRKIAAVFAAMMAMTTIASISASADSAPKFEAAPKMSFAASTQGLVMGTPYASPYQH